MEMDGRVAAGKWCRLSAKAAAAAAAQATDPHRTNEGREIKVRVTQFEGGAAASVVNGEASVTT